MAAFDLTRITLESSSTRTLCFLNIMLWATARILQQNTCLRPQQNRGTHLSQLYFSWNLNSRRWKESSGVKLEPSEGFILTLSLGQTLLFLASLSMFSGAGWVGEAEFDRKEHYFDFVLGNKTFKLLTHHFLSKSQL